MSVCERCFKEREVGSHGWMRCPLEPRSEAGFHTPQDKLFEFVTTHVKPGTEIRSKGQWDRFLRRNNLTADLSIKEKMDMASRGYAQKKRKEREEKLRRELTPIFHEALQQLRS